MGGWIRCRMQDTGCSTYLVMVSVSMERHLRTPEIQIDGRVRRGQDVDPANVGDELLVHTADERTARIVAWTALLYLVFQSASYLLSRVQYSTRKGVVVVSAKM
jgi:hypothetical protein